jgi:hypothetical protein
MSTASSQGPFSQPNRVRLVNEFLGDKSIDPATAWMDVYRLLLWVDNRTGVAHCYESDKSQPGRAWYPRSLQFHEWVSAQFGVDPLDLKDHVDWMFSEVIGAVIAAEADEMITKALSVQQQLFPQSRGMPVPGDDPRLHEIVESLMPADRAQRPSDGVVNAVLREIYAHMNSENKRANLLGRGFEDVLDGVISRLPSPPAEHGTQKALETIPGFRARREGDKQEKVDLWAGDGARRRVLVSAKWSVRADREKQLPSDLQTYVQANDWRDLFEFAWITNEFDPARLVANATNTQNNRLLFDSVVHICPEALGIVHEFDGPKKLGRNPGRLRDLLQEGRIVGLDAFLAGISGSGAPGRAS